MKLNTTLVTLALAFAGGTASAATVGQLTDLATHTASDNVSVTIAGAAVHGYSGDWNGSIDYVYNFNLTDASPLTVDASEWESPTGTNVSMNPAVFTLYTGTSSGASGTSANIVGSAFSFQGGGNVETIYDLTAGNYFFEVTGTATGDVGASWTVSLTSDIPTTPLPSIPEPANMALLLAGLGLMGFMAKRRARD